MTASALTAVGVFATAWWLHRHDCGKPVADTPASPAPVLSLFGPAAEVVDPFTHPEWHPDTFSTAPGPELLLGADNPSVILDGTHLGVALALVEARRTGTFDTLHEAVDTWSDPDYQLWSLADLLYTVIVTTNTEQGLEEVDTEDMAEEVIFALASRLENLIHEANTDMRLSMAAWLYSLPPLFGMAEDGEPLTVPATRDLVRDVVDLVSEEMTRMGALTGTSLDGFRHRWLGAHSVV